jgi:hypothetical protein
MAYMRAHSLRWGPSTVIPTTGERALTIYLNFKSAISGNPVIRYDSQPIIPLTRSSRSSSRPSSENAGTTASACQSTIPTRTVLSTMPPDGVALRHGRGDEVVGDILFA